jgi:hypothetical protein
MVVVVAEAVAVAVMRANSEALVSRSRFMVSPL